jgi:prepilin-type N-terminal cleavage/methylation domain-containing protein
MHKHGFTLIELMVSLSILALALGTLMALFTTLNLFVLVQDAKMTTDDNVQRAMLAITRELRNAAWSSVVFGGDSGTSIQYQIPADIDGNGTPLDQDMFPELGPVRTISRDFQDLNGDGLTASQLIVFDESGMRVLANGLCRDEDLNNNGRLDPGEDLNDNGALDRGVLFERVGRSIAATLSTENVSSSRTPRIRSALSQIITPRN